MPALLLLKGRHRVGLRRRFQLQSSKDRQFPRLFGLLTAHTRIGPPPGRIDHDTSTNLATWSVLGTVTITNQNGTAPITDTNAPGAKSRFYRAVQP